MSRRPQPYWPSFHGAQESSRAQASAQEGAQAPTTDEFDELDELTLDPTARCLRFIAGYSDDTQAQVRALIQEGRLGAHLKAKYPTPHEVNTDKLLRAYTQAIKQQHLRSSPTLNKVCFDSKLHLVKHALGTQTFVSRTQGSRLTAKRELRISSLFKRCPEPLLRMIVTHELAHLREKEHNAAFYQLCVHIEPRYHQLEFEARLYLIHQELFGSLYDEGE